MIDLTKYANAGWGLSTDAFQFLLSELTSTKNKYNIVEFGSGISTQFFHDLNIDEGVDLEVWSFDHDPQFAFKGSSNKIHLSILPLVQSSPADYELMFTNKQYDRSLMSPPTSVTTRTPNMFYDITMQLPRSIDLIVLDGPHGNGRNFAWLHCQDKVHSGTIILIDDNTHYDFEARLCSVIPSTKITTMSDGLNTFAVYRVN